jgi:hypothetical protein
LVVVVTAAVFADAPTFFEELPHPVSASTSAAKATIRSRIPVICHNFFTLSSVEAAGSEATVRLDVTNPRLRHSKTRHRHDAVTRHALRQEQGIPYEVERVVCSGCRRVLSERRLRRAAA